MRKATVTGTFVSALEDEFSEIRITAINSIVKLGNQNKNFANESRELLFYLLNDESDLVRIKTLQGLD